MFWPSSIAAANSSPESGTNPPRLVRAAACRISLRGCVRRARKRRRAHGRDGGRGRRRSTAQAGRSAGGARRRRGGASQSSTQRGAHPEAEARRANADAQATCGSREHELRSRGSNRSSDSPPLTAKQRRPRRVAQIRRLESEAATSAANVKRLEFEIDNRRIRAPIAGRLSECAALRPGAYITAGQQLGIIVPGSKLQVVAEFSAEAALGKIHPGQAAIVKLEGFPGRSSARFRRALRAWRVKFEMAKCAWSWR